MKIFPALMSAPMALATNRGDKTVTRRLPTAQNCFVDGKPWPRHMKFDFTRGYVDNLQITAPCHATDTWHHIQPQFTAGDLAWVREVWRTLPEYNNLSGTEIAETALVCGTDIRQYAPVFCGDDEQPAGRKRHARFMPRWASRNTLPIVDVSIERLQDISEEDAKAEGCVPLHHGGDALPTPSYKLAFRALWDSLNASRGFGWDANPPVVVIRWSEVIHQNIDDVLKTRGTA